MDAVALLQAESACRDLILMAADALINKITRHWLHSFARMPSSFVREAMPCKDVQKSLRHIRRKIRIE